MLDAEIADMEIPNASKDIISSSREDK